MSTEDTPTMIDEAELRTVLTTTAERYEVPESGPGQVRAAIRQQAAAPTPEPLPNESWAGRARRTSGAHRTLLTLAGVAAAILLVGFVVVNVGRDSRNADSTSRDAASSRPETGLSTKSAPSRGVRAVPDNSRQPFAGSRNLGQRLRVTTSNPPSGIRRQELNGQGSGRLGEDRQDRLDRPAGSAGHILGSGGAAHERSSRSGGFVAETSTSEQSATPTGSIALRVPADRFEDVLVQARKLGKVQSATTGAQDVTSEYIDVTGRLRTMKEERNSLSLVLTDAKNVPDILAVRDRLNVVQNEIEQLEGRRKVLDDQTSLATLTVSLHEKEAPKPASLQPASNWVSARRGMTRSPTSMEASRPSSPVRARFCSLRSAQPDCGCSARPCGAGCAADSCDPQRFRACRAVIGRPTSGGSATFYELSPEPPVSCSIAVTSVASCAATISSSSSGVIARSMADQIVLDHG